MTPRARSAPAPAPAVPLPEQLADHLHSLAIHLLRRLRRHDTGLGLTGPRASALSVIAFGGPVTLGELASAEQVRPPTMTRIVRALEAQRLVRRVRDPHDRRVVRLHVTPKGRALLVSGRRRRVAALAAPLGRLQPADLATLQRATDLLARVVREIA